MEENMQVLAAYEVFLYGGNNNFFLLFLINNFKN